MTTERNAQGVDGLAEVMGLLGKANFDELSTSGTGYLLNGNRLVGDGVFGDKAAAIAAAVNYLRSHGEAIRELVDAATDAHDFAANAARNSGGELDRRFYRLRAALAKFPEPRP